MKTFVKLFVIICGILSFSTAYMQEDPYIGKSNVEKTILIEKYLIGHKEKIINFSIKYEVQNDVEINRSLDKINYLIESLNKIQNNSLSEEKENLAISTILIEIKNINDDLKIILQKKKDIFQVKLKVKNDFYSNLGYKLSFKIEEIYNVMYDEKIYNNSYLSEDQIIIKNALNKINSLSKDLKYFSYRSFENQEQIKQEFIQILKNIRKQILILKKNI